MKMLILGCLVLLTVTARCSAAPAGTEVSCEPPNISNGKVNGNKKVYAENDILLFQCNPTYKPSKSVDVHCTINGWNPQPYCEEISCYPEYVTNGNVKKEKDVYKEGETIELVCNYGYRIESSPDDPRKCTKNGWFPPLKCISLTCDRPRIDNGQLYYNYYFPRSINSDILYECYNEYLAPKKDKYGKSQCTDSGWNPRPKCTRSCTRPYAEVTNGRLGNSDRNYLSGEKVDFTCNENYYTPDGKRGGERECLPNGKFTDAKCSRYCKIQQFNNGKYEPKNEVFEIGQFLQITCNNGFKTRRHTPSETIQCLSDGWQTTPECIVDPCVVEDVLLNPLKKQYGLNERVEFSCPRGCTLKGESIVYCRSNGWSPKLPSCEVKFCTSQNPPLILRPLLDEYHFGKSVELSCPNSFTKIGASDSTCTKNGWNPELPSCEETKTVCSTPPNVQFGDHLGPNQPHYRSGFQLEYKCPNYFTLVGNRIVTCKDKVWDEPPVCLEPCTVQEKHLRENNIAVRGTDAKKIYLQHDEFMEFTCIEGYEIADISLLRLKCNKGVIPYPKCNKIGSCLLSKETMKKQDIFLNRNTAIQDGESVLFECNKGMKPENTLEATCRMKVLTYPKCIPAMPCRISLEELDTMNVRLKSQDDVNKVIQDGEEVDIECKAGSESPVAGISLKGDCHDGKMKYSRCFEGSFCRIDQDKMNGRHLQLNLKRNDEGYYGDGEDVHFICRYGFRSMTELLTGRCVNTDLAYPRCIPESSCQIDQVILEQSNLGLDPKYNPKDYYEDGEDVRFSCLSGFMRTTPSLNRKCANKILPYPSCIRVESSA